MAQGGSPRNPLAFASVLYPGKCLASQPIHLGSEVGEHGFSKGGFLTSPRFPHGESVQAVTQPRPLRAAMVVAYVVPATFGAALLRILGAPPFRLLVLISTFLCPLDTRRASPYCR